MTQTPKRSRPNWKAIISAILFPVLLGLLVWYVYTNWDDMRVLLSLSPQTLMLLLGLGLASCIINCYYHLAILSTFHLKLTLTDWMGVVCVSNAIAYVLPMRADLVFSAAYYKHVKGLAYTKSISMSAGNIVFGVAFSLLQILVALLCLGLLNGQWPWLMWMLFAAGAIALSVFLWLALRAESSLRSKLAKHKLIADVIGGFNSLLRNKKLLWQLLICLTASNLAHLFTSMVCFRAVGVPVTLYEALFYSSVGWLAGIVAIVPGNIGLKEGIMGIATQALGNMSNMGVAASLLDRVTMMIVYIAMGLIFAIPVMYRLNRGKKNAVQASGASN